MPELPEVETVRQELGRRLTGRKIESVEVRLPKLVALGPSLLSPTRRHPASLARRFSRALIGRRIAGVGRAGKLLQIKLTGRATLLVHLKMSGQILVTKPGVKSLEAKLMNIPSAKPERLPSKHTHLILGLSGGVRLFYNDTRQFGTWRLVSDRELPLVPDLNAQGPDALDPGLSVEKFIEQLNRVKNRPIKAALTDQTALAGVGNIYADESLFRAKLHPQRLVKTLTPAEWRKLFRVLQIVLREAIAKRGSSVGDFIRPDGSWGRFGQLHRVYQKSGQPCRVCGTTIRRITLAGRGTHFCPFCQPRSASGRRKRPARPLSRRL